MGYDDRENKEDCFFKEKYFGTAFLIGFKVK